MKKSDKETLNMRLRTPVSPMSHRSTSSFPTEVIQNNDLLPWLQCMPYREANTTRARSALRYLMIEYQEFVSIFDLV